MMCRSRVWLTTPTASNATATTASDAATRPSPRGTRFRDSADPGLRRTSAAARAPASAVIIISRCSNVMRTFDGIAWRGVHAEYECGRQPDRRIIQAEENPHVAKSECGDRHRVVI